MALTKTKDQNWHAMFHRWVWGKGGNRGVVQEQAVQVIAAALSCVVMPGVSVGIPGFGCDQWPFNVELALLQQHPSPSAGAITC